jgi:hypothetical protein
MNACQKEYSFENESGPSVGTLSDDGTGDCLPKTVTGAYVVGTALVGSSNFIEVEVNVTQAGSFIIYTDTVNGMFFRVSGVFSSTGLTTVQLKGNGTPQAVGISNFIVHYGTSGCTITVTTVSTLATFTLDGAPGGCMGAAVAGTYTAGTLLTSSNNVTINVNVLTVGAYTITSPTSNSMTFTGSGVFVTTGPQAIVLTGSGTPASSGSTNIPLTAGSSTCSFTVTVAGASPPAVFTVNCGAATVNGTYTQNVALTSSNTVAIGVNVATAGAYAISATANGMTFTGAGTFTGTGATTVTLTGSGTPSNSGAIPVPVTGGTASCNFTVTVAPGAGAATFAVNCGSANINGTYTAGVGLVGASNTVDLTVNVATPGSYTITTTLTNGMTFTATGTFAAAGAQNVTLAGSGTPTAAGSFTIPVPSGTTACSFSLTVDPGATTIGTWSFKVGTTTHSGTFFDAIYDISQAPLTLLDVGGDNTGGDQFSLGLFDFTGGILANEQYSCSSFTGNAGYVYFTPATGSTYDADPSFANTMVIKVISHNTATKTIMGTFSGNAIINGTGGGTTPIAITQGTFTVTYP